MRHHNANNQGITILTQGSQFSGKLYCRGTSRIAGRIEGHIYSEGTLVVEDGAFIKGEIRVDEVIILGAVKGNIYAKHRIELMKSAVLEGEVSAPVFIIQEGARFNGRSFMQTPEVSQLEGQPLIFDGENFGANLQTASVYKFPDVKLSQ